ncbi:hypothetical protein PoB_001242400 [Plakobranchus ocellatus]|uniref:Uncharacterized protein n=1 Tax=Plakobranchus ocellatus TaxID=259542 RepID=A0AAV3YS83_9GAST|nr:hypothetical protein PoB_001242400 [Plakobranchus ocellatus]
MERKRRRRGVEEQEGEEETGSGGGGGAGAGRGGGGKLVNHSEPGRRQQGSNPRQKGPADLRVDSLATEPPTPPKYRKNTWLCDTGLEGRGRDCRERICWKERKRHIAKGLMKEKRKGKEERDRRERGGKKEKVIGSERMALRDLLRAL